MSLVLRLLLTLSSAALLILSFPNFNQPWCAWVALTPWLVALRGLTSRQAFGWSYLVGLVFFLGSIWWLVHVTFVGLVVLCLYLALYFGLFGWFVRLVGATRPEPSSVSGLWSLVSGLVLIPAAWVALEYLRSHLLSGFGWNLLGYSQTPVLPVIQLADATGVWGISFVIVMVNVAIAGCVGSRQVRKRLPAVMGAAGCVIALWLYGQWRLHQPAHGTPVRIAVVQGDIPQEAKWDKAFQASILERYERLTREAAAHTPHLIVWPEASVPGVFGGEDPVTARVTRLAQSVRIPLLVGAPMSRQVGGAAWHLTNSAALLEPDGALAVRYDKLHLVPFGEFVPFEGVAPWLRSALPPIGDFVPGHDSTVFQLDGSRLQALGSRPETQNLERAAWSVQLRFSVLICFEDIFPDLARQFVRRGARLLATITNDAWFGHSAAAYQHAQASTFRAVELRVPMVRAANTGWSGCIDPHGRWLTSVRDATGEELFIEGVALCEVTLDGAGKSLYQRWGDWVAWLCCLLTIGWMATVSKQSTVHS